MGKDIHDFKLSCLDDPSLCLFNILYSVKNTAKFKRLQLKRGYDFWYSEILWTDIDI